MTPEERLAMKVALERAGDAIKRTYGPALEDPGLRQAFLDATFGPRYVVRVKLHQVPRAPGEPPLMGVVSSDAIAAHPTQSLRASDHLERPGETPQQAAARRARRR